MLLDGLSAVAMTAASCLLLLLLLPLPPASYRGTEKFEKKAKLYDRGGVASPLAAGLAYYGQTNKEMAPSKEAESAATGGGVVNKPERSGSGGGGGDIGLIDDDWMTLTSRSARSPAITTASSPPPRNHRRAISSNNPYSKTVPRSSGSTSKANGGPVRRRTASPSSPPLPVPVSAGNERPRRETNTTTSIRRGASMSASSSVITNVVDISQSDDEDEQNDKNNDRGGGDGGDGHGMMTPLPTRAQLLPSVGSSGVSASSLSSGRSVHSVGEKARAPGPGGGSVVPLISPTYFRSMTRGVGVVVGSAESGAMNWRGRGCPVWLQREIGALSATGVSIYRMTSSSAAAVPVIVRSYIVYLYMFSCSFVSSRGR